MAREHDEFFWISAINKATVAVEGRNGLFDEALLRLAAKGIDAVEKAGDQVIARSRMIAMRVVERMSWLERPAWIAVTSGFVAAMRSGSYAM